MQSQSDEVLASGGEMAKLVQSMDWSKTPLGPMATWPQSLRTTVSLALASNFPISIAWGPQRVQIYNDGYWPICGDKHPTSMGQDFKECWRSAWPVIGEAFERASRGETQFLVNQRMFLYRHGYLEETFFTFSFSPILDESGGVGGLFHPVVELTQQSLAERRLMVTQELADRTADVRTVEAASSMLQESLAGHALDLPFVLVYLVESSGTHAHLIACTGMDRGAALSPEALDMTSTSGWPFMDASISKQALQVDRLEERFGPFQCGSYPEPPKTAMLMPILLAGMDRPFGFVVAGVSARRALDAPYRAMYDMLRDTLTNTFTRARSYEEARRRTEELAALDLAKTAFFSNVSHEFRTPLTLILGPIQELLAGSGDTLPKAQRQQVEVLHRNALRLLKLVNTLLEFSRIEAGRIHAAYEMTDLSSLTLDLASTFRSAIEKAGLTLEVDCPPIPEPVYVDREMWEKIVLNLLSNAFKFTFEGRIRVSLRWEKPMVRLEVSDTGAGIPAIELPSIFERFRRVQGARARTHEGSGIGLALVQELVKLHGGEARVDSALGKGTTFTISIPTGFSHLPKDAADAARALAPDSTVPMAFVEEALRWLPGTSEIDIKAETMAPDAGERDATPYPVPSDARILLVDDNADMREYVSRLLSPTFTVESVPNGAVALTVIRLRPPDLVIADIMMPELDGFGLLRALRADPETRTIPVILLSARAGEEASVEGLDAGADDYLVKPFSANELLARVRTHIAMVRIRKDSEKAVLEMREQVWQSQKLEAIGRLSGGIAHDFNNLLTAINGYAELSLNVLGPQEAARPFVGEIQNAGRRAASLVSQILAYSRKQIVTHQPLALDVVVGEMEVMLRRLLPEHVNLIRDTKPGKWTILADQSQVEQALMNVVLNCSDAMPKGGRLFVNFSHAELGEKQKGFQLTAPPGEYVVLSIR
ncbi:MAG: ATP-binding protein, partial [Fibrobacterota bacterium]|nr:ATP-binding protein [Fibrobacterota bacterium]